MYHFCLILFWSMVYGCTATKNKVFHHQLIAQLNKPYLEKTGPVGRMYCAVYYRAAWKKLQTDTYYFPLIEGLVSQYAGQQPPEDWLIEQLYHKKAKRRVAAEKIRRLYQVLSLSCPPIAKQIPMFERGWKHPQPKAYIKSHVPTFAASPIAVSQSAGQVELLDRQTKKAFSYVVVGAGVSGSMVAHQLHKQGHRVLLLEAGHFSIPGVFDTRQMSDLRMQRGSFLDKNGLIAFEMAQAVGGGGTVNADLAFSPVSSLVTQKFDVWRQQGWIATNQWTTNELTRAYQQVRSLIGTRNLQETEINANNMILWKGASNLGLQPDLYALNRRTWQNALSPVSPKKSPIESLLFPGLTDAKNTLGVLPRAKVVRVIFDPDDRQRATHVEIVVQPPKKEVGYLDDFHDLKIPYQQTILVPFEQLILSAGSIGSTVILQRSAIRNANLGKGIVGHISFPVLGRFDQTIDANRGTTASVFVDDFASEHQFILESMTAGKLYVSALLPAKSREIEPYIQQADKLGGFGVMLVDEPVASNRVVATESGYEVMYQLAPIHREKLRVGIAKSVEIMFAAGAQEVIIPSFEKLHVTSGKWNRFASLQEFQNSKEMQFVAGQTTLISAHLMGSNKMGANPATSVVDQQHKVWGTQNLYVVDASVLPTSPGANPMQTLYTLALIAAQQIGQKHAN